MFNYRRVSIEAIVLGIASHASHQWMGFFWCKVHRQFSKHDNQPVEFGIASGCCTGFNKWLVVEPVEPPTPLKNDGLKVSWDDDIPNCMDSHKKCSKAPTRVDHKYMDHFYSIKLLERLLLFWTQTRLDWIGYPALPKRRPKS